jgi:putative ABC transport system permease protein
MIRGRLTAVNGKPVTAETYTEDRAKAWPTASSTCRPWRRCRPRTRSSKANGSRTSRAPEVSVEQGIAKTLNWKLGDKLRFDIAGSPVDVTITSIRKLDWGSMRVNFFAIINPAAMTEISQSWITAFHLPQGQAR